MPQNVDWFSRLMLVFAGLLGAGGIAAAAASSHFVDDRTLGAVALVALTQAPAVLAFGLVSPAGIVARIGALAIGAGASLFAGILAARSALDLVILPGLAPVGGTVAIGGWVLVAIAGLIGRR